MRLAVALCVVAACGQDRARPSPTEHAADAGAVVRADAAPVRASPIALDGRPLTGASVTLGASRFRLPAGAAHLVAIGDAIVVVLVDGRIVEMDPVTGELRPVAEVAGTINTAEARDGALVLAVTPDAGDQVAVQVDVTTGAVTPAFTAEVAWGLDVHGDELLVHDIRSRGLRVVDLATRRSTPVAGLTENEMLVAHLLAGGRLLVHDDDERTWIVDRANRKRRVRLDAMPYWPWPSPDRRQVAYVKAHAVDPDAVIDTGPEEIVVWDVARDVAVRRLALAHASNAFAWLADGGYVTGEVDGRVTRWDARGRRVAETDLGEQMISRIVELPSGRLAVSTAADALRVLELGTLTAAPVGPGHVGTLDALDVAGDHLVSLGLDGTVRLWDLRAGTELRVLPIPTEAYLFDVAFEPGGDGVAVLTEVDDATAALELWTLDGTRRGRITWPGELSAFAQVMPEPGGGHVVVGKDVRWQIDAAGHVGPPIPLGANAMDVTVGPGVVAINREGHVELDRGVTLPARRCAHVNSASFSASGELVAIADGAPTISLWRRDGTRVAAIVSPDTVPFGLAVGGSPPVVVDPDDAGALIWDVEANQLIRAAIEPLERVRVTDDRRLIGSTNDGRIGVWDLATLRATGEITTPTLVDDGC